MVQPTRWLSYRPAYLSIARKGGTGDPMTEGQLTGLALDVRLGKNETIALVS